MFVIIRRKIIAMLNESLTVIPFPVVAPLIVMFVTLVVQWIYRRQDKNSEISSLAKVLRVEVENFIEAYEKCRLPETPPEDVRKLNVCDSVTDKNVYVFTNSVHRVGVFELEDVRALVKFYMRLKGLIDSTENL